MIMLNNEKFFDEFDFLSIQFLLYYLNNWYIHLYCIIIPLFEDCSLIIDILERIIFLSLILLL